MQASAEKIWAAAQEQLRSMLSADTYNLWFAPLARQRLGRRLLVLEVANDFCEVWLKDNYMGLLQDVLARLRASQLQVKFKVGSGSSTPAPASQCRGRALKSSRSPEAAAWIECRQRICCSIRRTLSRPSSSGNNNNFAHAAALAVAQAPGKSYNPLFLYGGVGLGKTHLLHAIGQHVARPQERRARRLCFVGEIHERVHRCHSKQSAREVPQKISPDGCAADR